MCAYRHLCIYLVPNSMDRGIYEVQSKAESIIAKLGEEAPKILDWCNKLYITSATTVYECEIASGLHLKGLQRRRHFGESAAKFRLQIGTANIADLVFPILYTLANSTAPASMLPPST
jgi:hypothetical protein